jgi:hypothetical protein
MEYLQTTFQNVPSTALAATSNAGRTVNSGRRSVAKGDTSVDRKQETGGVLATHASLIGQLWVNNESTQLHTCSAKT